MRVIFYAAVAFAAFVARESSATKLQQVETANAYLPDNLSVLPAYLSQLSEGETGTDAGEPAATGAKASDKKVPANPKKEEAAEAEVDIEAGSKPVPEAKDAAGSAKVKDAADKAADTEKVEKDKAKQKEAEAAKETDPKAKETKQSEAVAAKAKGDAVKEKAKAEEKKAEAKKVAAESKDPVVK